MLNNLPRYDVLTYQDYNDCNNFAGWLLATEDFEMLGEKCLDGDWIQLDLPLEPR